MLGCQREVVRFSCAEGGDFGFDEGFGDAEFRDSVGSGFFEEVFARGGWFFCEEDDFLSPLGVGDADGGGGGFRLGRGGEFFDGGEGNHLASDFCEPFGAAEDFDESVVRDLHDVAGVMPSVFRGDEHAGVFGEEVAEHDIRSADGELAAGGNAGDGVEFVGDSGEEFSHRARLVEHRGVHAQSRRAFGRSVSFEEADAEDFRPDGFCLFLEFFRAREDVAHRVEVVGVSVRARVQNSDVTVSLGLNQQSRSLEEELSSDWLH